MTKELANAMKTLSDLADEMPSMECRDWKMAINTVLEALKQEPCEDAVSRKAVLDTLDNMNKALDEDRTVESYKVLLKECYEVLPPVTPTRKKWIPVSEDLPKDGEEILMNTVHFGAITGIYDSESGFMTHYSLSSADMASVEVTAWMPLPGPYKAEMESE